MQTPTTPTPSAPARLFACSPSTHDDDMRRSRYRTPSPAPTPFCVDWAATLGRGIGPTYTGRLEDEAARATILLQAETPRMVQWPTLMPRATSTPAPTPPPEFMSAFDDELLDLAGFSQRDDGNDEAEREIERDLLNLIGESGDDDNTAASGEDESSVRPDTIKMEAGTRVNAPPSVLGKHRHTEVDEAEDESSLSTRPTKRTCVYVERLEDSPAPFVEGVDAIRLARTARRLFNMILRNPDLVEALGVELEDD